MLPSVPRCEAITADTVPFDLTASLRAPVHGPAQIRHVVALQDHSPASPEGARLLAPWNLAEKEASHKLHSQTRPDIPISAPQFKPSAACLCLQRGHVCTKEIFSSMKRFTKSGTLFAP